tara:strand:- start:61 stop:1257 length:1197 start_codon:yes stop_codon:yes gene_type:complete
MDQSVSNSLELKTVNLYIENSASIYGYVNGPTGYVNVINDLAQFRNIISETSATFSYKLISGKKEGIKTYDLGSNTAALSEVLTPKGLAKPTSGNSDLNDMFKKVLESINENSISLLISDGIYDVGDQNNPLGALETQGLDTRTTFINEVKKNDTQMIVIKLFSDFKGTYYHGISKSMEVIDQKRPYYVWVFGHKKLLDTFFSDDRLSELKEYDNHAVFHKLGRDTVASSTIAFGNKGLRKSQGETHVLEMSGSSRTTSIAFSLAVDYSELRLNESYLTDINNYKSSNGFEIESIKTIERVKSEDDKVDRALKSLSSIQPTHIITVVRSEYKGGLCEISFMSNLPGWIAATSIQSDNPIKGNTTQTFGFSTLINGINQAFQEVSERNEIQKFTIKLKN